MVVRVVVGELLSCLADVGLIALCVEMSTVQHTSHLM